MKNKVKDTSLGYIKTPEIPLEIGFMEPQRLTPYPFDLLATFVLAGSCQYKSSRHFREHCQNTVCR